jgi:hypothetical protein
VKSAQGRFAERDDEGEWRAHRRPTFDAGFDLAEVAGLMDDFERVFESGLNAQKKHLLHRLVKEARVQDRGTAEVWYSFPRPAVPDPRTVDSHI